MTSRSFRARRRYSWRSLTSAEIYPIVPTPPWAAGRVSRPAVREPSRGLADPDLPRLPAARHRQQHLQRLARQGARAARPRGPPAVPGPSRGGARVRRRHGGVERRGPLGFGAAPAAWSGGSLEIAPLREPVRCTAYVPEIGGVLPVYVADRY